MKKIILAVFLLSVVGCSYFQEPEKFIKDPHFAEYQDQRDKLERQYLRKEINYAEYVEKRDALDREYDGQVISRDEKIRE